MVFLALAAVSSFVVLFAVLMFIAKLLRRREISKIDEMAWQLGEQRRADATSDDNWKANKNMTLR